jgi:pyruvate kinase
MVTIAEHLIEEAGYLRKGDILGIVAGTRTLTGSTNFLRLHVTGDQLPDTSTTSTPAREPVHA